MRIKEQETCLTLQEHDDDDDEVGQVLRLGGHYVGKQRFVAKNFLYQIVLLCALYLL